MRILRRIRAIGVRATAVALVRCARAIQGMDDIRKLTVGEPTIYMTLGGPLHLWMRRTYTVHGNKNNRPVLYRSPHPTPP